MIYPLLFVAAVLGGRAGTGDTTLVLTGGRYLDVRAGVLRENGSIVLRGGRIVEIHKPGDHWKPPADAVIKKTDGQTILPGLIDAHVHLTLAGKPEANAAATLRAGFTTVIDLGSANGAGIKLRNDVAAGRVLGPRIIAAGSWIGTRNGVCEFGGATINNADEAVARTRSDIAAGADVIKLCVTGWPADAVSSPDSVEFKAPLMNVVMPVAKASNRPVYAHAIGQAGALLAAGSGVRALAHTPVVDSVSAARITRAGVFLISTLNTLSQGPGGDQVKESFGRLHRAGARIVLGTDAGVLTHGKNADELVTLTQAGLTPIEALRAATLNGAAVLGMNDIGEIAVGGRADLVMVSGDPLSDVQALTKPILVIQGGRPVQ
jgi:imidazolonepropionase-like amidohydrolase